MAARAHHVAFHPHDLDASLRFYCDGIGMSVLADFETEGEWPALFGAPSSRLRSVMLGDPERRNSGIVELVTYGDGDIGRPEPRIGYQAGFMLISFFLEVDGALRRLAALGVEATRVVHHAKTGDMVMACVRDPDGVLVELIDGTAESYRWDR